MSIPLNVLAIMKGDERYVFVFDDESLDKLRQTLRAYAEDPELSFNWIDAGILMQKARILTGR